MPNQEFAKVTVNGVPVDKPCPIAVGGGFVKSQSTNAGINLGKTIPVGNIKRFSLRFDSNQKNLIMALRVILGMHTGQGKV